MEDELTYELFRSKLNLKSTKENWETPAEVTSFSRRVLPTELHICIMYIIYTWPTSLGCIAWWLISMYYTYVQLILYKAEQTCHTTLLSNLLTHFHFRTYLFILHRFLSHCVPDQTCALKGTSVKRMPQIPKPPLPAMVITKFFMLIYLVLAAVLAALSNLLPSLFASFPLANGTTDLSLTLHHHCNWVPLSDL